MPWAYKFFPKGAILEQIDVIQHGKSINPFDDAPHCKIGDEHSVFALRDQANQLSHDLCRVLRHKIGNCRGSAFKCDEGGWVDIDAIIDDRQNNIFPPKTSKARRYGGDQVAGIWAQEIKISDPSSKVSEHHEPERREGRQIRVRSTRYSADAMDGTDLGVFGPQPVTATLVS